MKKLITLFALLSFFFVFASCSKDTYSTKDLYGIWNAEQYEAGDTYKYQYLLDFKKSGSATYSYTQSMASDNRVVKTFSFDGSFSFNTETGKVTLTVSSNTGGTRTYELEMSITGKELRWPENRVILTKL